MRSIVGFGLLLLLVVAVVLQARAFGQFPGGGVPARPSPGGTRGVRPSGRPSAPSRPSPWQSSQPSRGGRVAQPTTPTQRSWNPWGQRSTPSVPAQPGRAAPRTRPGIDPNSSRFFPRPAAPIPRQRVPTALPSQLDGTWSQTQQAARSGNFHQVRRLVQKRLQTNRDLTNLMGAVSMLERAGGPRTAIQPYRAEAWRMAQQQVKQGAPTPLPYVTIAKLALEDQKQNEFQTAAQSLMRRFPEDPHSQFFSGIRQLQDGDWQAAETSLLKARDLGMPEDTINRYLKLAIDGQKWIWEYAYIVFWLLVAWLAGLGLLYVCGRMLSAATLRTMRGADVQLHGLWDRILRRTYRVVINLAGVYYFLSLPMLILSSIALPLALGYALLMLPTWSLILVAVVLVLGIGGLLTAINGLRAAFIVFRTREEQSTPRPLTEQEGRPLWALSREVAKLVGTRPVDDIWLTPGTDLAVAERGSVLARIGNRSRRVLLLGVAVIDELPRDAFKSILAHEYAHFIHRDTAVGSFARHVEYAMLNFVAAVIRRGKIRKWDVAIQFLRYFPAIFYRLTYGACRLREVHADQVAVTAYGRTAFELGLRHSTRKSIEFDSVLDREFNNRLRNLPALASFYSATPAPTIPDRHAIEAAVEQALNEPSQEWDTHPSPGERIRFSEQVNAVDLPISASMLWDCIPAQKAIVSEMDAVLNDLTDADAAAARETQQLVVEQLTGALREQPQAELFFERARYYHSVGEDDKAIEDLDRVLHEIPGLDVALYLRAVIREARGHYEQALEDLAPFFNEQNVDAQTATIRAGQIQLTIGRPEVAIELFTQAINMGFESWSAHVLRGQARLQTGQFVFAKQDFHAADRIMPFAKPYVDRLRPADPEAAEPDDEHSLPPKIKQATGGRNAGV